MGELEEAGWRKQKPKKVFFNRLFLADTDTDSLIYNLADTDTYFY